MSNPGIEEARLAWPRRGWWRFVLAIAAALLLGFGTLAAVYLLGRPLALLILGVVLAAGLSPLVEWLDRTLPRVVAIILVYGLLLLLVVGLGSLIVPALVGQANAVIARVPELTARLQGWFERWGGLGDIPLLEALPAELGQITSRLLQLPLGVASAIFEIFLVVFVSFYALLETPAIRRFVLSLAPEDQRPRFAEVLSSALQAMGGYVRGTALNGVVIGVLTYIGLMIIGVDYTLVLALLAGVLEVVPVIGPIIAAVPMLAVALLDSPTQALVVLIFVTVLQQAESNLLLPFIMRSQTEVSPLLVILALVAGSAVGGLLGALVAIPLAAALRVIVREVVAPAIRGWAGAAPQHLSTDEVEAVGQAVQE